MGTLASLETLYDNIAKANENLNAAGLRSETERYTSTVTGTFSNLDVLYTFFDFAFPGCPSVRRFTKAERTQRRQTSASLRRAMTSYASIYASTRNVPGTEPWLQSLLFPTVREDEEIYEQMNQERMAQFLPNTPAGQKYKQSVIDTIQRKNPEMSPDEAAAQAEQELPKQRGGIVEHYVQEAARIMEDLDKLAGPDVPADRLAMNLGKIMGAKRINDCLEKYMELADSGFIQVSQETRDLMDRQKELRPRLTMATSKLEAMANPMYEYFDPTMLGSYDMAAMKKVWDEFRANEDPAWRAEMSRKHAHFNSYVTEGVYDNFSCFMQNAAEYSTAQRELAQRQVQDALSAYSFEPRLTVKYSEVPSSRDSADKAKRIEKQEATHTLDGIANLNLYNDKPTAYVQGFRVIVVSPAENYSGITVERPERLYNYSLSGTAANLAKTLEDADRWYKTNKHGYGDMRRQLQEIRELGKLPKDFTPQDIQKRRALYVALGKTSRRYLKAKGDRWANDVEANRVRAAQDVKNFVETKLQELDMITAAKGTLERYRDVPPDQLQTITARENGTPEMKSAIKALDQAARKTHPVKWLQGLYSKKFLEQAKLPEKLSKLLTRNLATLKTKWDEKKIFEDCSTHNYLELSLGTAVAAEMILAERSRLGDTGGPVEFRLSIATDEELSGLGAQVLRKQLNGAPPLNEEDIHNALLGFDPQEEPNQYIQELSFLKPAMLVQNITARYLTSIQRTGDLQRDSTLSRMVNDSILGSIHTQNVLNLRPAGDGLAPLAHCVMRDCIQMERSNHPDGPGALEQQLMENPDKLAAEIMESPKFRQLADQLDKQGLKLHQVLVSDSMRNFAQDYISYHNDRLHADRDKLLHGQKGPAEKGPEEKGKKAPEGRGLAENDSPKAKPQKGAPTA